jgi:hypothetical protein
MRHKMPLNDLPIVERGKQAFLNQSLRPASITL